MKPFNAFWEIAGKNLFVPRTQYFFQVSKPAKLCPRLKNRYFDTLGDPGTDSGGEGKSKRAEKYGTKKRKGRREEPLGTMSYQTSSKRLPPFCLLIGQKNTKVFWHQSSRRPFLFFVPYFLARLDFPSPPLSAPGSSRMIF